MITKRTWLVIALDIIVLLELTGSIGIASHFKESMTVVFLYVYIPAGLLTIIIGKLCLNRFFPADQSEADRMQPVSPLF
jgi:hypothetical protein